MKNSVPSCLSDTDLLAEITRLARCERQATVQLIVHLAELDARRLYLGAGFSSLFTYCTEVLRLSEHEAYNRIEAARAARRFPGLLAKLDEGSLSLTTIRLLAPHLTPENKQELLSAASGKSKRGVEELLASLFPQPAVPTSVRKLPVARPFPSASPQPPRDPGPLLGATAAPATYTLAASPSALPAPRPVTTPLAPDRYRITFTVTATTYDKLRLAQDLLRHAIPSGDTAEIIDRALTALIEDLSRKKFAATDRPRAARAATAGSRHVPASLKREIWHRDGGRCAFVAKSGRRCNASGFLEYHHVRPYGVGGETTAANVELRCVAHNGYEADLYYGTRRPVGGEEVVSEPLAVYGRRRPSRPTRSGTSAFPSRLLCARHAVRTG